MFHIDEILKPIDGYNGKYLISNYGRVYSLHARGFLKPSADSGGYYYSVLYGIGSSKNERLSRLVAKYFLTIDSSRVFVNHKDGDKSNNHVDNLEWCNQSENEIHASESLLKLNNFNQKTCKNTSGYVGVSKKGDKWYTYCNYKKKTHFIGYFDCPHEASIARSEYMEINGIAKSRANNVPEDAFDAIKQAL
jgi:hypothetical protein